MKKYILGIVMMSATSLAFSQEEKQQTVNDKPIIELNTIAITPDGGVAIQVINSDNGFDRFVKQISINTLYPLPPTCPNGVSAAIWQQDNGSAYAMCNGVGGISYPIAYAQCGYCPWLTN